MKTIHSLLAVGLMSMTLGFSTSCVNQNDSKTTADANGSGADGKELENRLFLSDPKADKLKFFLNITEDVETDSSFIYTTKSLYENDTVGVKIEVLKSIPAGVTADGVPDEEKGFVPGAVKFSSLGEPSDGLVNALIHAYGKQGNEKMTTETISPLVFSSNKEAVDLTGKKQSTYSFKLFFENKAGAEAEVFAVLDLYRKSFEISEKDSVYRDQLISAFTGK